MNRSIRKELDLVFKAQEMTKKSVVREEIQNFNKSCIITAIGCLKSGTWTGKCQRKMQCPPDMKTKLITL